MFNCSMCNKPSQPRTPATRVVVETRSRVYHNYDREGKLLSTTQGEEIVKEELVCSTCMPSSLNSGFNALAPALEFLQPGVASRANLPTYHDYIPDGTP